MSISHLSLRQAVVDGANFLVRVGAISMSHHGNFSVRVPNTDTILLTATSSFDNLKPENLALLDLEGKAKRSEDVVLLFKLQHLGQRRLGRPPDLAIAANEHRPRDDNRDACREP